MVWITVHDSEKSIIVTEYEEIIPHMQLLASSASSYLDQKCALSIYSPAANVRLTGIICTIDKMSRNIPLMEDMLANGMNIARLCFAAFNQDFHLESIRLLRQAADNYSKKINYICPLAIALDIKGPEIRTGKNEPSLQAGIKFNKGDTVKVTTDAHYKNKCNNQVIYIDYENLTLVIKPGNRISIDFSMIEFRVKEVFTDYVVCVVELGGILRGSKEVNLPGVLNDLPVISEKDKSDILFGLEQNVDFIFISFIRNANPITEVRNILGEKGKHIKLIAKIECQECIYNLDEIIEKVDGVMVARGDLGVEIPIEKVFIAQKIIISRCNKAGKPVICARNMLDSMCRKLRPTRAESSDVANAILDGSDCVQLTQETINGIYPVLCVKTLAQICKEAESAFWQQRIFGELLNKIIPPVTPIHALGIAAVEASTKCLAVAIIVDTTSGNSPQLISRYRPRCPIIAVTRNPQIARQLHLYRGVLPLQYVATSESYDIEADKQLMFGLQFGKDHGFIKNNDNVLLITRTTKGAFGTSYNLQIIVAQDFLKEESETEVVHAEN